MAEATSTGVNEPAWVDLSSSDAQASRDFYGGLFGWKVEVNPDPQYGGYAMATVADQTVAGIGPTQNPDQPTAWNVYIGTDDVDALATGCRGPAGLSWHPRSMSATQGRMAVFQDPSGAFISAWKPTGMSSVQLGAANSFGWAELSARGLDKDLPFYGDRLRLDDPDE